jgi:hypothetical protein
MRFVLTLLAVVLLGAAPAGAQSSVEARVPAAPAVPAPVPATEMVVTAPAQEKVQDSRAARDLRDDYQLGPRGSFWWLVGVVVVAGIILAVVL